jgi:hypothetical protein
MYRKCAAAHLIYLDAHLAIKEAALAKTTPLKEKVRRFRADDQLLKFIPQHSIEQPRKCRITLRIANDESLYWRH